MEQSINIMTNKIIAKTKAGEWVINENICPDSSIMEKVVEIRKNPLKLKSDDAIQKWEKTLGPYIQKFADVLETELRIDCRGLSSQYS